MKNLKIYDWMKMVGFVSIVVATIIATVIVHSVENQIAEIGQKITKFYDSRIISNFSLLDNRMQSIQKTLNLLEANIFILNNAPKNSVTEIQNRALSKASNLAEAWTLVLKDSVEVIQTKKEIKEIFDNRDLSFKTKLRKIEEISDRNMEDFSTRLKSLHEKRNQNIDKKSQLDKSKRTWNILFVWLQIGGLILISGSEIIEKMTKK